MNSARSSVMLFSPANGLLRFGLPTPGMRRDRIAHLRRQHRGVALADEDDRLAALAQRAELHRQALERRQRHLPADALDDLGRVVRVALLERVARLVVELAALEALERAHDLTRDRASASRCRAGCSGYITATRSLGAELCLDELDQRLARRHAVAEPHVVVVEEEDEDARVLVWPRPSPRRRAWSDRRCVSTGAAVSILTSRKVSTVCGLPSSSDLEVGPASDR